MPPCNLPPVSHCLGVPAPGHMLRHNWIGFHNFYINVHTSLSLYSFTYKCFHDLLGHYAEWAFNHGEIFDDVIFWHLSAKLITNGQFGKQRSLKLAINNESWKFCTCVQISYLLTVSKRPCTSMSKLSNIRDNWQCRPSSECDVIISSGSSFMSNQYNSHYPISDTWPRH